MTRPPSPHPTPQELAILKVLWQLESGSVRDVRAAMPAESRPAYTSVMTIMKIMVDKGYLARTRRGRAFVYAPTVGDDVTAGKMVGDLVDRVFDGSAAALMVNLLERSDLDREEIARLRKLLNRKAREAGS